MKLLLALILGASALAGSSVVIPTPTSAFGEATLPAAQSQDCGGVRVSVIFGWIPSYLGEQWLDLSLSDNAFAAGTFVSAGPLNSATSRFR